jgi:hypothetical protein
MAVSDVVLSGLCSLYLRTPVASPVDTAWTFNPPLTTAEQATFADLQSMANFSVDMTLAEWQSIKADAANLKAYVGIASPTLAQTAAATKSIIRVLAVIVRA